MRHTRKVLASQLASLLLVACVGDSPVTNPGSDAGGSDGGGGQDGGGGDAAAQVDAAVDAGPSVTGDFESVFLLDPTTVFEDVATDASGDAVMVGILTGSVQIGGFQYTSSNNSRDVLVVRLAANNGIKWAKTLGGNYTDDGSAVALDANGDVYVVGDYNAGGPAQQSAPFGTKTLVAPHGGYNSFVAKLDGATGNTVWAMSFDAASTTSVVCKDVVAGASSVVVGCLPRGPISYTNTNNTVDTRTAGTDDPWVAELDPSNGHVAWGMLMTGNSQDGVTALALDAQNRLYVGGQMKSTNLVGDTPSFTLTRKGTNSSATDAFVVRLDPGTPRSVVWQQVYGATTFTTNVGGLAVGPDGSVYLQGGFSGTRDFGDGAPVTAAGTTDMYLLHLASSDGKTLGKATMGGNGDAVLPHQLAIDDVGQPIVAATYAGPQLTLGGTVMPAATSQNPNAFVAKTSPDLATLRYVQVTATTPGDAGTDYGVMHLGIATNPSTGQSVTAGTLHATADLGDGNLVTRAGAAYMVRRKR